MSPSPAAPSSASMTAWVRTSASEWPSRPLVVLEPNAAQHERAAGGELVAVVADAGRDAHRRRPARRAAAPRACRSSGVVILRLRGDGSSTRTVPALPLDEPGVVGRLRAAALVGRQRPLERRPAEHLRGLHRPQPVALERCAATVTPSAATCLIVSVTGAAAITASAPVPASSASARAEQLRRGQRPRRVVDDHRVAVGWAAASPRATDCRADGAAGHRDASPAARRRADRPAARRSISSTSDGAAARRRSTGPSARPASGTSALGRSCPRRSPRPAATITATAVIVPAYSAATATLRTLAGAVSPSSS